MPLEFATAYTLTVTGLRDAYGTEIAPLSIRFTTAAYVPPVLDATRIVFSAPDETTGLVTVSADPRQLLLPVRDDYYCRGPGLEGVPGDRRPPG